MIRFAVPGPCWRVLVAAAAVVVSACATVGARPALRDARAPNTPNLARLWDAERVSSPVSPLVDHDEVRARVLAIRDAGGPLTVRDEGRSEEGREIYSVSFGRGPFVVMMWSQMHGDEPTATSALFDLYEYVRRHAADPAVTRLLERLTVHTVPMLNPDGAERFQRRNAQGIDINRDALDQATREGRLLKDLRDRWRADVGYNLHNQNWRTSVGDPAKGAAISLLSVAFDEARSMSDGRLLTKRLAAVVRDALEPFALGRIGRYDDTFEPRAFGDQLTRWGTPVLLIETGPWPEDNPDPTLVRLNYIALVRSLHALADGSVHQADPVRYDSLPENRGGGFHTVVRGATVHDADGRAAVTDVGLVGVRRVAVHEGRRIASLHLTVTAVGDLTRSATLFQIEGRNRVVAPARPGAAVGDEVTLTATELVVRTGPAVPADLMVLVPVDGDRYRIERLVSASTVLGEK